MIQTTPVEVRAVNLILIIQITERAASMDRDLEIKMAYHLEMFTSMCMEQKDWAKVT